MPSSNANLKNSSFSSKLLAAFFRKFGECIRSEKIRTAARKRPQDFTRIYKFPWFDVIYYYIFRHEKCTSAEVTSYYASIGKPDLCVSKQAVFKVAHKVRPEVFSILIRRFAQLFYRSGPVKNHKGYILLAEDGTINELAVTDESLKEFGFVKNKYVKTEKDVKKTSCRSGALYDVTNGLIVDFTMNPITRSEIPIYIEHLQETCDLLGDQKVILLADRYYPGVELFALLEKQGWNYCIRGKSNFFKDHIAQMKTDDEWITVTLDKAWLRRLKYAWAKERFSKDPAIRIRIVRRQVGYIDNKGKKHTAELMFFTNLPQDEFDAGEITNLYSMRWDLEVSYKTLKTDCEWERYFSTDNDVEKCCILSKVLFHNITGIVRKELNLHLQADHEQSDNKHVYRANIVQLSNKIREVGAARYIRSGNVRALERTFDCIYELRHKIKVPVRPGRHYKRWGRIISVSHPMRFRIDGRNWPNTVKFKGRLQTIKP